MSKLSDWSVAVRARDGVCRKCGTSKDLHAHHVKPKSERPDLALDLDNGVTLCYRCHKAEHEAGRPVRIRSERPRVKTLMARVKHLEHRLDMTEVALKTARAELRAHGLL